LFRFCASWRSPQRFRFKPGVSKGAVTLVIRSHPVTRPTHRHADRRRARAGAQGVHHSVNRRRGRRVGTEAVVRRSPTGTPLSDDNACSSQVDPRSQDELQPLTDSRSRLAMRSPSILACAASALQDIRRAGGIREEEPGGVRIGTAGAGSWANSAFVPSTRSPARPRPRAFTGAHRRHGAARRHVEGVVLAWER